MDNFDEETMLKGQAEIWQYIFNLADSMALRCAVELRIADIIHSHGHSMTLSEIAAAIESPSQLNIDYLKRIMRLLVRKNIFSADTKSDSGEFLHGLTRSSMWILHDADESLASIILMETHPWFISPWYHLSACVKEGGNAFKKEHKLEVWDIASGNPEFNRILNDGMGCTAKIVTKAILSGYKDGFNSIKSLVDVGGGTGTLMAEIVKAHSHIKGINYDLPHVVATAHEYNGVVHVGGDMFKTIPNADAVFMKWIMHDWSDEDCVKILKNCGKAIPQKTGKVIIVEVVLQPDEKGLFDNIGFALDLVMIAHSSGGKERTESKWKKLLEDGGFPRYNIIKLPSLFSIIEAYHH